MVRIEVAARGGPGDEWSIFFCWLTEEYLKRRGEIYGTLS